MLADLLKNNESQTLEFKENGKSLLDIIKTIVAFANSAGGTLIIGIQDKTKKIIGVENALNEEERLINAISDSITPFMIPNVEIQTYRKKELIIITIAHMVGPCYITSAGIEKGTYIRFGSTNRIASSEMLDELKLFAKKMTYDERPAPPAKDNALDWPALETTFAMVKKKINESKAIELELLVESIGKTVPSIGGIILFGKNRAKAFPDALIRCVRYSGTNKAKVLDFATIKAYPVQALEEALLFIEKNSARAISFEKIRRTVIPQYPLIALREAILNAIIHADYAIMGSSLMIALFDDRIEISNPGGIPLGITLERALAGSSRVRNRVIARVFRELKLIEQWGSGLQRIIDSCEKHGLVKPKFEDFTTEFMVTLYNDKNNVILDASQKKLLARLKKKEKISTKEAAELWGIAPRNARIKLKTLLEKGFIQRVGTSAHDPQSTYVLVK